jgi:hypothetical protein
MRTLATIANAYAQFFGYAWLAVCALFGVFWLWDRAEIAVRAWWRRFRRGPASERGASTGLGPECWGGPLDGERYALQPSPMYELRAGRWVWCERARREAK